MNKQIENFGRNLRFSPSVHYVPESEVEVLKILERHRGTPIRVVGSLHSWSKLVETDGVTIDVRKLNSVSIDETDQGIVATVGAGCQIRRLLHELARIRNATLPSVGLIDKQTVAGAISTGTHGSGKHSLSHYVTEVRLAHYDENGSATIRTITEHAPDELRAARCSLGLLGVILSVRFRCRANYRIEEHMQRHETLHEVLEQEPNYPLQQFFLIPWAWCFYAQHRRETEQPVSRMAGVFHLYWYWMVDVLMHIGICLTSRWLPSRMIARFYFKHIAPSMTITNWQVVDDAHKMLTMEHDLFWHIEIEIFVQREQLAAALEFVEAVLKVCDGEEISPEMQASLCVGDETDTRFELLPQLESLRDRYTHNYPICVRRILADDTLISMASGNEVYSISFISYAGRDHREPFLALAKFLAESTAQLFDARPHWGKVNPLPWTERLRLYPNWEAFVNVCNRIDPSGQFRNAPLSDGFSA